MSEPWTSALSGTNMPLSARARALPQSARVACDASAHQQPAGCMGGRSGDMHTDGSHAPSWPEDQLERWGRLSHWHFTLMIMNARRQEMSK